MAEESSLNKGARSGTEVSQPFLGPVRISPASEGSNSKLLVLVDGSSYLYRAFHALPDLRSPAGEPTGAIYGVLNMLKRLIADYKADFLGCVFDAKGKTFRDEVYPEYKAHRPPMPDDLAAQIEPLMEAIRAMGWPLLVVEGVEADDVIGTLAREASAAGLRTVVSTGDKDLAQLVDAHVTLINTMSNETLDVAGVSAKFGVPPGKIVDYLALVGDAVDNIPGVDKVGPKTASKWIGEYGSLDGVLAHAEAIKGVAGENLRKSRDWLPKGRALATVKCDVPLESATCAARATRTAEGAVRPLGFKTWLREVKAPRAPIRPRPRPRRRHQRWMCRVTTRCCWPRRTSRAGSGASPQRRRPASTLRPRRLIRSPRSSWACPSRWSRGMPRTSPSRTAIPARRTRSARRGRSSCCGRGSRIRRSPRSART
jgi:5'-3' exonuclease